MAALIESAADFGCASPSSGRVRDLSNLTDPTQSSPCLANGVCDLLEECFR